MASGRIGELDGIRGLAILLVVFAHTVNGVHPSLRGLAPSVGSLGGLVGVQLFFVLSGFLITRILLSERERRGSVDLLAFYRRRVSRLYPSLLLCALVVVLFDPWSALRAVTYTSNFVTFGNHGAGTLGHSWSLSVEEQFYLVWPALLVLSGRHAYLAAGLGVLVAVALQYSTLVSAETVYHVVRWDALLAGCLLALRPMRGSSGLFYAGAAVLALYTLGLLGPSIEPTDYTLSTLACVAVVASHQRPWLTADWLRHIGRISYAWYLWHVLAMRLEVPMLLALPASLLLAEATYWTIDKRAQTRRLRPS